MSSKIEELREQLFATLRDLRDPVKPMEIDRAKAISEVAQTIINSAKVEVDFINATGAKGTGFVPSNSVVPRLVGTK